MKTQIKIAILAVALSATGLLVAVHFVPKTTQPIHASAAEPTPQVLGLQTYALRGIPLSTKPQLSEFIAVASINNAEISAKSYYIYDRYTKQVLAQKNSNEQTSIASLTKLLTIYLSSKYLPNSEPVLVDYKDLISVTPLLRLKAGDKILPKNLAEAILVGSSNDAAKLLGNTLEAKTGKSIQVLMNEEARALGLTGSLFSNPLGFDSISNFSTASDVQKLIEAVGAYYDYKNTGRLTSYSFTSESGNSYKAYATNKLITKDPELVAIKTGYTEGAQGAMVTQFNFEGRDIVIIVLGSTDRESDTAKLKSEIKNNFSLAK